MAKKTTTTRRTPAAKKTTAAPKAAAVIETTPVRYSALPKLTAATAAPAEVTFEQIATRAYELFAAGRPGSEMDHWLAAEAELRIAA